MSGVAVIVSLLKASNAITTIVPAARIMAGELPLNFVMPAILVEEVDSQPRLTVAMNEPNRMHTERVQVSALVKGARDASSGVTYPSYYRSLNSIMKLLLAACPHTHGTVNGINVVSILPDGESQPLPADAIDMYSQSRDFIVKWKS